MDEYLSFVLYSTFRHPVLDFFSILSDVFFSASLLLSFLFIYWFIKNDSKSFFAFFSFLLNNAFILLLKFVFARARPLYGAYALLYSFPSAHAANAFFLATLFSYGYPDKKMWAYAVASFVAFSRVYTGTHFIFDVLIGSLLGFSFAAVCLKEKGSFDKLFNCVRDKLNL